MAPSLSFFHSSNFIGCSLHSLTRHTTNACMCMHARMRIQRDSVACRASYLPSCVCTTALFLFLSFAIIAFPSNGEGEDRQTEKGVSEGAKMPSMVKFDIVNPNYDRSTSCFVSPILSALPLPFGWGLSARSFQMCSNVCVCL